MTGLWRAAIYEGVKSNGARFVLPLTDARPGREERTESPREAIAAARHGWVKMVSYPEQNSWITTAQTSEKFQSLEPKWFDGEFSKLIETAFRGRIILTQKEAPAQFRKTSRRETSEDELSLIHI